MLQRVLLLQQFLLELGKAVASVHLQELVERVDVLLVVDLIVNLSAFCTDQLVLA